MLDQDTARLLVSEALKDRLSLKENDENQADLSGIIVAELILQFDNEKISFSGPVIDMETMTISTTFIQLKSSIQDCYELITLLNTKNCICSEYNILYSERSIKLSGPYNALLQKVTNFDYGKNQCVLGIELIKTKS